MSLNATIDAFEEWRRAAEPIVMVTVIHTEGSTYSKPGHRILIAASGDYQGLVSGGCLEGDLASHARDVIDTGTSRTVLYDLRDEADEIWGMGIGCNGVLEVLLQRLDVESDYEPFATIARCAREGIDATCSVVTACDDALVPAGATLIDWCAGQLRWQLGDADAEAIVSSREALRGPTRTLSTKNDGMSVFHAPIRPVPRLLVIGAGPDAVPLVRMACELGWRVTIADHRETYIKENAFDSAERRCLAGPGMLEDVGDPNRFVAAVVMTHHLDSDRAWLGALAATEIKYIGLLGPPARRDRLVGEIDNAAMLKGRLHGPVGLPIGADGPESIALSILAEMQAFMRTGDSA